MLFVTFSNLWSLSYFFYFTYSLSILSLTIYTVSVFNYTVKSLNASTFAAPLISSTVQYIYIVFVPSLFFLLINISWVSPSFSSWYGHLIVTTLQIKFVTLIFFFFLLTLYVFSSSSYLATREIYDYIIVMLIFLYWLTMLFFSNSLFAVIFIIEVISSLIFLIIIVSTFSTVFFYRNLSYTSANYLHSVLPTTYLTSLIFFFWVSLLTSLNLFVFLLLFFIKFSTFDWYLVESVFMYFIQIIAQTDLVGISLIWLILLVNIFIKCGIAPFFFWKPTFFKGLSLHMLFFYVVFFYFFIFLFFVYFFTSYFGELFYFYSVINWGFSLIGLTVISSILLESSYIKVFVATSSILNSLFVFMSLTSARTLDFYFWL